MDKKYTVADIFAGAGGISKAFQQAGAEIIWANEIDRDACSLYRENMGGGCLTEGDITQIDLNNIPDFEILVAGFPYQVFSVLEKNRVNDKNGNIFLQIVRILNQKKPRVFLLESPKYGGAVVKIILKLLKDEGYYLKHQVLNSMDFGNVPHIKERLYIVGFRELKEYEMFKFPQKIDLTMNITDIIDLKDKKEDKYYYTENSKQYIQLKETIKNKDKIYQFVFKANSENKYGIREYSLCPNLSSVIRMQYVPIIYDNFNIRKITPSECFAFQGYFNIKIPIKINDNKLYKYAAQSSTVTVVKRIAQDILKCLEPKMKNTFFHDIDNKPHNEIQKEVFINNIGNFISQNEEVTNQTPQNVPIENEIEFTKQKVIPALKKKSFFDVRYNHGSDEYGKDVIYKYYDNFESIRYGAVQVKYGDISGSVKSELDPILSQIEDAFLMPYIDIKERTKIYISQLLIICSGRYTKNAREKIMEKMKKGYDVRFFDGQDIDNLLE